MRKLLHVEKLDYKFVNKNQVLVLDSKGAIVSFLIVLARVMSLEKLRRFRKVMTLRNDWRTVPERTIFKIEVSCLKVDGDWQVEILNGLLGRISLLIIFMICVIPVKSLTRNITLLHIDIFKYLEHVIDHQN